MGVQGSGEQQDTTGIDGNAIAFFLAFDGE
jgi:hypothetical protein